MIRILRADLVRLKVSVSNNITVITAAGKHHTSDSQITLSSKGLECHISSYASTQADVKRNNEGETLDDFLVSLT